MQSKLALTLTSVVIAFGVWRVTSRAPDAPGRTGSAPSEAVAPADLAVVEPVGTASELVDLGPPAPTERQWLAPKLEPQTIPPSGDWNFTGTVTSIDGVALSGAAVVLRTEPRESARATCDAEGRYRLSIDVPADVSRFAPIGIMLTAEAPGFRREERTLSAVRASDEREDPRRIDFALVPSQHVLGVATDPSGEPLLELPVALVDQAGAVRAGTRTDARGAFALELADAEEFWVAAGSVEAGYAVAGAFVAPASGDLDVGAILVVARGRLAGIVTFPDDSPVPNTRIVARRVGDPDGPALPDDAWLAGDATVPVPGFRRELGSSHGFAQTDANGGFTFTGLLPGEYELELPYLGDFREAPTAGPFLTGEFANVVVLAYSVHVRVVDQVGRAVPGARLWIQRGDTATIAESRGLEGSWDFGATPGPWVVTASLGGAAPAEHAFEVVEGTYETWIELELDFEPTTGRLQVLVEDAHGTPLDGFTVTLWRADETVMVADYTGLVPEEAGVLPPIPVGAYTVRAVFTSFADDGEPTGAHFSAKGSATIGVARLSTVRLATTSGGRMQLRIDDASGDLPPERVEVRVTLGDGLGVRPTTVHNLFRPVDDGLEIDVPRLGAAGYTDLLRSGAYTLRAEADGYRILEQSVVILAGETTPIGLLLERE